MWLLQRDLRTVLSQGDSEGILKAARTLALSYRLRTGRVPIEIREIERKYDPTQARAPAGQPDGGRWVSEQTQSQDQIAPDGLGSTPHLTDEDVTTGSTRTPKWLEAICKEQYDKDIFQCSMVGIRACYEQAALRYSACLTRRPIPPLNY